MERKVKLIANHKSPLGAWSIMCKTCPILPHTEALGLAPKACVLGIQTNTQGAVALGTCEHYVKESCRSEGKTVYINCTHGEARPSAKVTDND